MKTDVLIVGAGPTGLVLALWLKRHGTSFRIVDARSGPGQASRAMAVQARTLELYAQLGIADEVVAGGIPARVLHLRENEKEVARVEMDGLGAGISPYPFMLTYPQDDHERLLVSKLEALGVTIEWNVELANVTKDALATFANGETCQAQFVVGCDGAHSRVRHALDVGFEGGTYEQKFYVADVKLEGAFEKELYANLEAAELALLLPVRSSGMQRVIGLLPKGMEDVEKPDFEAIRPTAERLIGRKIAAVSWFSSYRVHHRVAERFRVGRCFLAGDAGHVHSPVGGQGMNTGIGDALNLAWKLASVIDGEADESLLDSYEVERIAFARKLVSTTDAVFSRVGQRSGQSSFIRTWLLPAVAPLLQHVSGLARRVLFATISQTRINYRESPLSEGKGGDRLPWDGQAWGNTNYDSLSERRFQIHVYGEAQPEMEAAAAELGLPIRTLPFVGAGLERDHAYLIRPDGYVALVTRSARELRDWATSRKFDWKS